LDRAEETIDVDVPINAPESFSVITGKSALSDKNTHRRPYFYRSAAYISVIPVRSQMSASSPVRAIGAAALEHVG